MALPEAPTLAALAIPEEIENFVDGRFVRPASGEWIDKRRPGDGSFLCRVPRSAARDVEDAIAAARRAQPSWAEWTVVARGDLVRGFAQRMRERRDELAAVVGEETGKNVALALAEADAAIEMGFFVAGEGRRYYGRTTTASMAHRSVSVVRQPLGVAALITTFNTPLPNLAWKVFPAILCGNAAVLKPSEEAPASARLFAEICVEAGVPAGVLNVLHGLGEEAGAALVESPDVALVSFTGSGATGRWIQERAGKRLAKVCLELGGKNALVVCDDADLQSAVHWAAQSAFSNAGQRCAAGSRIVVFDAVYEEFRDRFVEAAQAFGDVGPVINERALERILGAVERARGKGARILCGGERAPGPGWHLPPSVLEDVDADAAVSKTELFGPVTILYRVPGFDEALALVNRSQYGLTAAIHTASLHRAARFAEKVEAGVVVVNGGTHGSEPHMGFGGVKDSGTGWREAGVEALDVYSDWKYVHVVSDPAKV